MQQDAARQAYEKMLNKPLSDDEYAEARNDLTGFFSLLIEIDRDLRLTQQTDDV